MLVQTLRPSAESQDSLTLTFDLQLAADSCLSVVVHGFAGVHTSVKVSGPTDLQRADTLNAGLPELGVVSNNHLILQPLNFGLEEGKYVGYSNLTNKQTVSVCAT